MEGCLLPSDCAGAFVNVYVGDNDIRTAMNRVESDLVTDYYRPIELYEAYKLDLEDVDYSTDEEGYPSNDDLVQLRESGGRWYGPFNCYPWVDEE